MNARLTSFEAKIEGIPDSSSGKQGLLVIIKFHIGFVKREEPERLLLREGEEMPEGIEVETKELQETIEELHHERAEHAKEAKEAVWTRWIALTTAILAVFAAISALNAGKYANESLIEKNNAVLYQAQASDKWSEFQAKSIKGNLANQSVVLLGGEHADEKLIETWKEKAKKYEEEKTELGEKARELEKERDEKNVESAQLLEHHEVFAVCVTLLQVAIALSAIAALTKQKTVWVVSLLVGVIGIGYFFTGFGKTVNKHMAATSALSHKPATTEKAAE